MANILMENEIHSMNGEIFWENMNIRFYCLETECKVKEETPQRGSREIQVRFLSDPTQF